MAERAPGGGDPVLGEQAEQGVDDHAALELAGLPESLRAEEIEGPPDQLEVEAQGEYAARKGGDEVARFLLCHG
jgi:hypothetical protein